MNLNKECMNLKNIYMHNKDNLDQCISNVFSVECPKNLDVIKDPEERARCKEQFDYLGWGKDNKCWFPEYDGIPTNKREFNKLTEKDQRNCENLFNATYSNKSYKSSVEEYYPWNIEHYNSIHITDKLEGKLCPRNKKKFAKIIPYLQNECYQKYNQEKKDSSSQGGCGIFENEWLDCNENQHYNYECTKCIDD